MSLNKKHLCSILVILALTIIGLLNLFSTTNLLNHVHYWDSSFFLYKAIEDQVRQGTMYLWSPLEYSGVPLLGHPEAFLFSLPLLLIILLKNQTILQINLTIIISFFLMGLGTYLFFYDLKKSHKAALIAALVFMFNGAIFGFGLWGNISITVPLSMMPFVLFFVHKALRTKQTLFYSIIASLFAALQIHAGGMIIFVYTFILIGCYVFFNLIGSNLKSRILKLIIVLLILVIFSISLSAAKLLPTFDFQKTSSRSAKFSYQEFLGGDGHQITGLKEVFPVLVKGASGVSVKPHIGFVVLILVLLSFIKFKNKYVIFFSLMALLSVLIASGSFVTLLAYKFVPFFGNLKNVDRFLVLFSLSASILAGYGYIFLEDYLKNKLKKLNIKNLKPIIFSLVFILIFAELFILTGGHKTMERATGKHVPLLDSIDNQDEMFRVHYYQERDFDLSHVIGSHSKSTFILYDLGIITGGSTVWPRDLGQYLLIAGQRKSTKLWGILNTKYIISDKAADIPNTKLSGNFTPCLDCVEDFSKHTHVYENLDYLPRSYISKSNVLVLGNPQNAMNLIFGLLLGPNFNPKTATLYYENNLNNINQNYLKNFDAVIIASQLPQGIFDQLRTFRDNGKKLLPDIFDGQNQIVDQDIQNLFNQTEEFEEVKIKSYTPSRIEIELSGQTGFLVLSETFSKFEGWSATINGKNKKIINTNAIVSGIPLDGETGTLVIQYKPKAFRKGLTISMISLIVVLVYFGYIGFKSFKKSKN